MILFPILDVTLVTLGNTQVGGGPGPTTAPDPLRDPRVRDGGPSTSTGRPWCPGGSMEGPTPRFPGSKNPRRPAETPRRERGGPAPVWGEAGPVPPEGGRHPSGGSFQELPTGMALARWEAFPRSREKSCWRGWRAKLPSTPGLPDPYVAQSPCATRAGVDGSLVHPTPQAVGAPCPCANPGCPRPRPAHPGEERGWNPPNREVGLDRKRGGFQVKPPSGNERTVYGNDQERGLRVYRPAALRGWRYEMGS
jgi:hypothetical protein